MRMEYFGDSYDVVKRFLIKTVAPTARWSAFPMFTHEVTAADVHALESFLGVTVASPGVITASTNRTAHLSALAEHQHVFLDPDTGIKLSHSGGAASAKYVFGAELLALCAQRHDRLLLVFDQSVPRGAERNAIQEKLRYFGENGAVGFAYVSHACFLFLSSNEAVCQSAKQSLLATNLPQGRLVGVDR